MSDFVSWFGIGSGVGAIISLSVMGIRSCWSLFTKITKE